MTEEEVYTPRDNRWTGNTPLTPHQRELLEKGARRTIEKINTLPMNEESGNCTMPDDRSLVEMRLEYLQGTIIEAKERLLQLEEKLRPVLAPHHFAEVPPKGQSGGQPEPPRSMLVERLEVLIQSARELHMEVIALSVNLEI